MISILICYNGWNGELPNNEVALQNERDPSYKLNLGWVSFLLMSCYVGVVFIAVSPFAVGATPSRDFSDILSRCELHRKEHKNTPHLAAGRKMLILE